MTAVKIIVNNFFRLSCTRSDLAQKKCTVTNNLSSQFFLCVNKKNITFFMVPFMAPFHTFIPPLQKPLLYKLVLVFHPLSPPWYLNAWDTLMNISNSVISRPTILCSSTSLVIRIISKCHRVLFFSYWKNTAVFFLLQSNTCQLSQQKIRNQMQPIYNVYDWEEFKNIVSKHTNLLIFSNVIFVFIAIYLKRQEMHKIFMQIHVSMPHFCYFFR